MSARIISIGQVIGGAADLGGALRDARRRRGWTQSEVARRSGVGLRFVSELENGKPTIQLDRALKVAASLDLVVRVHDRSGR